MKVEKKLIKIVMIVALILIEGISIFLTCQSYLNKDKIDVKKSKNKKDAIAIIIEDENNPGNYIEYGENTWPDRTKYAINKNLTSCIDGEGKDIDVDLTYNRNKGIVTLKSKVETYCYIYFDYNELPRNDYEFYIKEKTSNKKYTNQMTNKVYLKWQDKDVEWYCVTEEPTNDPDIACDGNWIKSNGATEINGVDYTFKNNTNEEKTVYAYIRDGGDGIPDRKEDKIEYDTKKPTLDGISLKGSALAEENKYTNSRNIEVTLTYKDIDVGSYCIIESSSNITPNSNNCTWITSTNKVVSYNLKTDNDGNKYVYAFVRDKANNISNYKSASIALDTQTPVINKFTVSGTGSSGYTTVVSVNLAKEFTDRGLSGVYEYCLITSNSSTAPNATSACNGKWTSVNSFANKINLGGNDGTKYLHLYIRDKVANVSEVKSASIILDRGIPNPPSVLINDGAVYATSNIVKVNISWSESDIVAYCLGNSDCTPTTGVAKGTKSAVVNTFNLTGSTVYGRIKDVAGNISGVGTDDINLDRGAPTVSFGESNLNSGNNGWVKGVSVTVSGSDNESGLASVKTCVTTGDTCTPNSNDTVKNLGSSASGQRVCAEVKDYANNSSGVICSKVYYVDGDSPRCNGVGTSENNSPNGVTGWINCSDSTSGCVYGSYSFSNAKSNVGITISDNAGNTAYCGATINTGRIKYTQNCKTGKRCKSAGCEACGSTGCTLWSPLSTGYTGCYASKPSNYCDNSYCYHYSDCTFKSKCLSNSYNMYECKVQTQRCLAYGCLSCKQYYQDIEVCGCDAWGDYLGEPVDSCHPSESNTQKVTCETIYSLG